MRTYNQSMKLFRAVSKKKSCYKHSFYFNCTLPKMQVIIVLKKGMDMQMNNTVQCLVTTS